MPSCLELDSDHEAAADVDLAEGLDVSAHQADQLANDGQAQARSTITAVGFRVGLRKGEEDLFEVFRCDPDAGVGHGDAVAIP